MTQSRYRFSTFLFAALVLPSVGDYVKYQVTNRWDKAVWTGTYELRITDYNSEKNEFLIVATEKSSEGKTVVNQAWEKGERLPSDKTLTATLENCVKNGGTLDTLTIAQASVDTCKTLKKEPRGEVRTWNGLVPFGVLKFEMTADDSTSDFFRMEAVEFSTAKP